MTTSRPHVLVTGAAGFIGKRLVPHLLRSGRRVSAIDRVAGQAIDGATWFTGDLKTKSDWESLPVDVDCLVHLAAKIGKDNAPDQERSEIVEANVLGTWNALQYANRAGIRRFVFASSMSVYGPPLEVPVRETHPLRPKTLYAATKASGEMLVSSFSKALGTTCASLRFSTVYGPGQGEGVVRRFLECGARNQPIVLTANSQSTFDFVFVDDVVEAIEKAIESDAEGPFNIGSGRETTLLSLAEAVRDVGGGTLAIVKNGEDQAKSRFMLDIGSAWNNFQYKSSYDLSTGIRRTLGNPSA